MGSKLKFIRRADINEWERLELAQAMYFRQNNYHGRISDLSRQFNVSRQFLYDNFNMCSELIGNGSSKVIQSRMSGNNF